MSHIRGASIDPPGYDAGKKIKGKKRHILVDTQGLLIHAIVHAAGQIAFGCVLAELFQLGLIILHRALPITSEAVARY